ncbi:MAG: BACON domain-containing protein [Desulfobacterales bacterium]|nr:BACON domain-containing protein [Desulfobacterales bacterium]
MFRNAFAILVITISAFFISATSSKAFLPPLPHRVGGTVTINGTQLTQANAVGYTFKIIKPDGTEYADFNNSHPEDTDGLSPSDWYLIDIPIYDSDTQPQGAVPGETAVMHIYKNSAELEITSPTNGIITVGDSNSESQINLTANIPDNLPPNADAGPDQTACEGEPVTLNGIASADPYGIIVSYQWEQIKGPRIMISNANTAQSSFIAPTIGNTDKTISIKLTIIDNNGLKSTDICAVNIRTKPNLSVTPISQKVPETSGTAFINIFNTGECPMNWTAETGDNSPWLTIDSTNSGTDDSAITVRYQANDSEARTGTIIITAPNAANSPQTVEIHQECKTPELSVSPSSFDIPGIPGKIEFSIAKTGGCNINWTTSSNTDWLSINPDSGITNRKITVNYKANPGDPRTGQIRITTSANAPQTIEVRQACIPAVLSVTPSSFYLPETRGETTFNIENKGGCPMTWKASENADWFSITPHHGTDSTAITVTHETNASTEENTGTITITDSKAENSPLTLKVTQTSTTKPLLWEKMETPVSENLSGIWGTSENNVYAVGNAGTILHYNGNEWAEMSTDTLYYLRNVWGNSENNVFAVGEQGTILHYDGNEQGIWTEMETRTSADLRSIWGSSGNNIFAVSKQGAILRYDGTNWETMPVTTLNSLYDIWGISENNVFTVGGTWNSFIIFHYDGNIWTEMPTDVLKNIPFSIWGSSRNNVFAVGDSGMIIHYAGSIWKKMDSNTSKYLRSIWGSSRNNVFAVGVDGTILHYNGSSWNKMRTDTYRDFYGIWGSSEDDVFVVGRHGMILRYSPTTLVKKTAEPPGISLSLLK